MLSLLDQLSRWEETTPEGDRATVTAMRTRMQNTLISHGIRPTARVGERLDLSFHEVVDTAVTPTVEAETIVEVLRMGYEMVADGLAPATLRQAKVVVAAGTEDQATDAEREV
jgi:molecular chaperone GrpE (heat shock protein)